MSKKRIDDDAYDVSPAVQKAAVKLLDGLTQDLEAGCRSVARKARLSDDAIGTFRRRYRLSLQRVLSDPATAAMNHRKVLAPAMKCHGQLAAAIAGFHRSGSGPLPDRPRRLPEGGARHRERVQGVRDSRLGAAARRGRGGARGRADRQRDFEVDLLLVGGRAV